jgi:hypothetical protein
MDWRGNLAPILEAKALMFARSPAGIDRDSFPPQHVSDASSVSRNTRPCGTETVGDESFDIQDAVNVGHPVAFPAQPATDSLSAILWAPSTAGHGHVAVGRPHAIRHVGDERSCPREIDSRHDPILRAPT